MGVGLPLWPYRSSGSYGGNGGVTGWTAPFPAAGQGGLCRMNAVCKKPWESASESGVLDDSHVAGGGDGFTFLVGGLAYHRWSDGCLHDVSEYGGPLGGPGHVPVGRADGDFGHDVARGPAGAGVAGKDQVRVQEFVALFKGDEAFPGPPRPCRATGRGAP